jgi:hypothetical protein
LAPKNPSSAGIDMFLFCESLVEFGIVTSIVQFEQISS